LTIPTIVRLASSIRYLNKPPYEHGVNALAEKQIGNGN